MRIAGQSFRMVAHSVTYSVVILDESYALLDLEHSEDLYQFQKAMIEDGSISKFINILPLKDDLERIVSGLQNDVENERRLGKVDQAEEKAVSSPSGRITAMKLQHMDITSK